MATSSAGDGTSGGSGAAEGSASGGGMLLATSGPYTPRMFSVPPEGGLIGRSRKCRISLLHDCEVSHNHAVIEAAQGGVLCIRDVGSTFGTYLNDKRLSEPKRPSEPHKLKAYDSIKVGQTSLRWRPIELIEAAVAVAVPAALNAEEWEARLRPAASLRPDDVTALVEAIALQESSVRPAPLPKINPSLTLRCRALRTAQIALR